MAKRSDVDMTKGNPLKLILAFSLPLLLGNLFQQLYNTVDTWVVGNFVGKYAFSAVGTLGPICNTLIGFFTGFSNGAGVVISQYFGAKDVKKVHDATHTYVTVTLLLCIFFTVVGLVLIPLMLRLVKSPAEVAEQQKIYLTIYFAGVSGLLLYNGGSAILRAVGDSKHPTMFLVTSASVNIVLDLLFVIAFKMGTAGVALATIISQFISAFLVFRILTHTKSAIKVKFKDLMIDFRILKKIFVYGIPNAIQLSVTAFSNVFVYSYVNFFGADAMAGWTAYSKVDQFIWLPMQSISQATMTYVGQNYGAEKPNRARKGANTALWTSILINLVLVLVIVAFAPSIVTFFIDNSETEVIRYGTLLLRGITPFAIICAFNQVLSGALRGLGKSRVPMIVSLSTFVVFRQIYLYVMANYISNTFYPIAFSFPAGWMLCSFLIWIMYMVQFKKVCKVPDKE